MVNIALPVVSALMLLILGSIQGLAQGAITPIDHLEVAFWPEFDQPAMLVIYRFQLAADTPTPAQVALPVPVASGRPHAVAWIDADGLLFDAAFAISTVGDWQIVQLELPEGRAGQLEYYADMDIAGTIRSYLFEWPVGFELAGMSYQVQEPVSATDLRVDPAPDSEGPGDFGLNYLSAELGPQSANGAPPISVTYENSTSALSNEALPQTGQLSTEGIQPLGQVSTPVDLQPANSNLLLWLLAAAGIIILGSGGYYFASKRRAAPQRVPRRREKRSAKVELEPSIVYCHECGTASGISDVYCRQCGTQLRK